MAVYFVTGKLRSGKGLFCSYMASLYYRAGLRVAANFLMDTEKLGSRCSNSVTVIPSIPSPEHLFSLGRGCPDGEMERFGILILDEAGTWLSKPDKTEQGAFLDWFIHSGKLGWDVYVQVQDKALINKDIFDATGEHLIVCERKDRIRVPVVSDVLEIIFPKKYGVTGTSKGIFPHLVSARVYIGNTTYRAKPNERHLFFASRFYGIHPTNHVFSRDFFITRDGRRIDSRAVYSALSGSYMRKCRLINSLAKEKVDILKSNLTASEIALAVKRVEADDKRKSRRKKIILYIAGAFFLAVWGYFSWTWLTVRFFGVGGVAAASPLNPAVPVSLPSAGDAVAFPSYSRRWRLSGWIYTGNRGIFILSDSSGHLRYVQSNQAWTGFTTVFYLDGELITFFSGTSELRKIPSDSSVLNSGEFLK